MSFNTLVFLAFFAVVLLVHRLPLSWRVRKVNLLWLSYVFYAAWNPPFVVLLWFSTLVDWYVGKWLGRTESVARRRGLLVVSLVVNLGMLSYFKYGGFIVENFTAVLHGMGIDWTPAEFSIVLPIGISFYTFQTLSYTIDVFQRRGKPCESFLDYALFVTFFPQLVAGPIVRSREFLPQCEQPAAVRGQDFAWGLYLFVIGLFEKVVLADAVLAPAVERVFDQSVPPTAADCWIGTFGFGGQIFFDFSGYSLCAIGVAKCLGFWLPDNFRFPFAAVGFAAFWRRWHITLSSWLRDYVYRSIRGSSVERSPRWMFNIMLTWGLIGLWHGAAWRFVLWGLLSGLLIVLEAFVRHRAPKTPLWTTTPMQFGFALLTFTGTVLTLLPFRSTDPHRMLVMAHVMFTGSGGARPMILPQPLAILVASTAAVLFLCHWLLRHSTLEEVASRCPWLVRSAVLAFMLFALVLAPARDRAFIYFQF